MIAEMTLAELVKERRQKLGMSQAKLAGLIGAEAQTISNLEMGRTKTMKTKFLQPLAAALHLPIEELTAIASVTDQDAEKDLLPSERERDSIAKKAAMLARRGLNDDEIIKRIRRD